MRGPRCSRAARQKARSCSFPMIATRREDRRRDWRIHRFLPNDCEFPGVGVMEGERRTGSAGGVGAAALPEQGLRPGPSGTNGPGEEARRRDGPLSGEGGRCEERGSRESRPCVGGWQCMNTPDLFQNMANGCHGDLRSERRLANWLPYEQAIRHGIAFPAQHSDSDVAPSRPGSVPNRHLRRSC